MVRLTDGCRSVLLQVLGSGRRAIVELIDQRRVVDVNLFVFLCLKLVHLAQILHLHPLLDLCHCPLEDGLILLAQSQEARVVVGQQNPGQRTRVPSKVHSDVVPDLLLAGPQENVAVFVACHHGVRLIADADWNETSGCRRRLCDEWVAAGPHRPKALGYVLHSIKKLERARVQQKQLPLTCANHDLFTVIAESDRDRESALFNFQRREFNIVSICQLEEIDKHITARSCQQLARLTKL